jgi:RNA polymerase sigma-70 factor (ECF subfamily)
MGAEADALKFLEAVAGHKQERQEFAINANDWQFEVILAMRAALTADGRTAAIAACHAEAPSWAATDWPQILILHDLLIRIAPSPIARLNRAVALWEVVGPEAALREVQTLASELDGYYLWHAVYAELALAVGQRETARAAELRALELTRNPAEQGLLKRRLATDAC